MSSQLSEKDSVARMDAWYRAAKNHDRTEIENMLAQDVVFFSPVVHTPQRGKKITAIYLSAAFNVFSNESFQYVREVNDRDDTVLEFEVEIDGVHINGIDMIRWNAAGQIAEFKVMVRPLQGVNMLHKKMQEMLAQAK
ncbi:nuclear transport factor 2 family protein [Pseudomonadales bacterium]|nr:nuclear transport factor 2 family protein [Pseudomonadales bacterium]